MSSSGVNLSVVFTRGGLQVSMRPGVLVVVFSTSYTLTGTFLPLGLLCTIVVEDIIVPGALKKLARVDVFV